MEEIISIKNEEYDCGEIRIGLYGEDVGGACISLALNHFENEDQWGGQPLSPGLAKQIGCLLIQYAGLAENWINKNNDNGIINHAVS